ncbi:hypothetical protein IFM89_025057 [Coptis chinensis]|uniref:Uncharacterized protein n=1 Tax=Coptis chinensis TaxID=261450 RepID=A0A835I400_9MAGN|nr:hypothetical protein IFM89_025057 [Coptis chinensis]
MSSTTASFSNYQMERLHHLDTRNMFRSSVHVTSCLPPTAKHAYCYPTRQHLYLSNINRPGLAYHTIKIHASLNLFILLECRDLNAVNNNLNPGPPIPSGSSFPGWSKWMLFTILPIILPLLSGNWGSLIAIKQKMDTALATVETVAEVIEEVAVKVDNIADKITDNLPDGSRLKTAIQMVDLLAENVIKGADLVEEVVDKVLLLSLV